MHIRTILVLMVALAIVMPQAHAGSPGRNGRILLDEPIRAQNLSGTGLVRLAGGRGVFDDASYSPDGRRIAYQKDGELHLMTQDGHKIRRLTGHIGVAAPPTWAPGGKRLAYAAGVGIQIIRRDGTRVRYIDVGGDAETVTRPLWTPDGKRIVFTSDRRPNSCRGTKTWDIWSVRPNGQGMKRLTNTVWDEYARDISPDGKRVLFERKRPCFGNYDVYKMGRGGDSVRRLTHDTKTMLRAMWSPNGRWILSNRMCRMRPDGTRHSCLGTAHGEVIDWQPLTGTHTPFLRSRLSGQRSWNGSKAIYSYLIRGRTPSSHEGVEIKVKLQKRSADGYRTIKVKREVVDTEGRFRSGFRAPRRGQCRLVLRFAGDTEYRPLKRSGTFGCRVADGDTRRIT